jgi:steroid delta-isomerase-like uncharacterized protein
MPADENKALVRRVFEVLQREAWPAGDFQPLEAFLAPDCVYHDPGTPLRGHEGFRRLLTMYRTAFPDAQFTIEDVVAEGDTVAARFTVRGTHTGELMGIAPSGKVVEVSIVTLLRIADGKIAEEWERFDTAHLLQQVGAMPAPAAATR